MMRILKLTELDPIFRGWGETPLTDAKKYYVARAAAEGRYSGRLSWSLRQLLEGWYRQCAPVRMEISPSGRTVLRFSDGSELVNYPTAKAGGLPSPSEPGRASGPVDGGPPCRSTV